MLALTLGNPGRRAGRSLIIAYHNVVPDHLAGMGDQSLHLPMSAFCRQMDLIQKHCRVVSLADLLIEGSFGDRPHLALTFDDAYRGAVELALPELEQRGLPSTLFVAPGLLGERSFWWDQMAASPAGLTKEGRRRALEEKAGRQAEICRSLGANSPAASLPTCYACASEDQVRSLSMLRYVTLGSHSWSHPNLSQLDSNDLAIELSRPLEWLATMPSPTIAVLAYPYGISSPVVATAAEHAGYEGAVLVEGGWLVPGNRQPWKIPRYNVAAGLSEDGLLLRLSGLISA